MESLHDIRVEWGDLDPAGIVFYPNFFAWADAAAHQLFRAAGHPMDRLLAERKMSFGLVASAAEFQSPARYGDRLRYRSTVSKSSTRTIDLVHRIVRAVDDVAVATVHETRVCMDLSDPARVRAQPVPPEIAAALEAAD